MSPWGQLMAQLLGPGIPGLLRMLAVRVANRGWGLMQLSGTRAESEAGEAPIELPVKPTPSLDGKAENHQKKGLSLGPCPLGEIGAKGS